MILCDTNTVILLIIVIIINTFYLSAYLLSTCSAYLQKKLSGITNYKKIPISGLVKV